MSEETRDKPKEGECQVGDNEKKRLGAVERLNVKIAFSGCK